MSFSRLESSHALALPCSRRLHLQSRLLWIRTYRSSSWVALYTPTTPGFPAAAILDGSLYRAVFFVRLRTTKFSEADAFFKNRAGPMKFPLDPGHDLVILDGSTCVAMTAQKSSAGDHRGRGVKDLPG